MKTCTQEITLYVDRKNKYKYVYGKQSDTKSRFLKVTIVDGGKKVVLGSDDNAKFRALKPDGTAVFNDCVIEPDGTILVELSAQTLAVEGQVSADVVIIGKSDEILATANFCIIVEKAPVGKDVESSNEFLALVEAMNQAVKKDQGKENSGKVLAVGDDGIVIPVEIKVGDNSLVVSATINGGYQVVSCDTTFDDIDKAYAAGSSMLMKASIADSSITVIAPFMRKTDSNDYIFALDDGSVIHAIAIGESGTWTTTDVQIDANKIPYELSEDFLADFPDFELESDTVKSGLDFAMYYAVAGMFAKYISCNLQSGSGETVSMDLQRILDGFVFPAMFKAHEHANKDTLDKLSVTNGKLQYNGSDVGLKGDKGDTGATGADGKTPIKGVDYWTAADKQEIIDDIHPVFYIDLAGEYPNYTCPVAMDDIKTAYNSGYNLVCRCTLGVYTATLPLFIPMPAANTWIFSGSGALKSMGFNAQSFTVAITASGVVAQNKELVTPDGTLPNPSDLTLTVGDTTYTYDGSEAVSVAVKPPTQSVTTSDGNITLIDNTEYRLTDVSTLDLIYPSSDFECWMRLSFAKSGNVTVTLPAYTKYIGTAPDFKNGETWELSFKDGVLAAQKVGEGT